MRHVPLTNLWGRRLIGPLLGLVVLLVLMVLLLPDVAKAGLVVQGQVRTPDGKVVVAVGSHYDQPQRSQSRYFHSISKMDQRIAQQLARRTVYRKAVFLDLRRAGHSWREIGRLLHIPQRVMRIAIRPVLRDHNNNRHWSDYYNRRTNIRYRIDD